MSTSSAALRETPDRRFDFGANWSSFLKRLDADRIANAERSLAAMLGTDRLDGRRFLDVGSGSGLMSLVARRMGATVHSFDVDPACVRCTRELRARFQGQDDDWTVEQGSILDPEFVAGLGPADVVYAWGVLHHTGDLWRAVETTFGLVADDGVLFLALYNDQGWKSRGWRRVKRLYCSGSPGRWAVTGVFVPWLFLDTLRHCLMQRRNLFADYRKERGMSVLHDWIDWLGGYPFEVASLEEVFARCSREGFRLVNLRSAHGTSGNNELVFVRDAP